MQEQELSERIERQLEEQAGIVAAVEIDGDVIRLSGPVESRRVRQAAEEIVRALAPEARIDNGLEAPAEENQLPEEAPGEMDADFTDQALTTNTVDFTGSAEVDPEDEVHEAYFAPTDPVVTIDQRNQTRVLGGFASTSDEAMPVPRSALDDEPGDEALVEAILRELREDAATTDLRLRVSVRQGVARLRGRVERLEDAEQAQEVAGRVPGVRDVIDELDVATL
jgi:osmotically-inducible protein OsmY